MNILFFVLNLIILIFIKQTNCVFILNNISDINDIGEFSLFTEFNSSYILGFLNNKSYLISPFKAEQVNYLSPEILKSTKIKFLNENSFALIFVKNCLIMVYKINESGSPSCLYTMDDNLEYDGYAVEYERNEFYISYLINVSENVNITYINGKLDEANEFKIIQNISIQLPESQKYNIFNFNNENDNYIIIIIQNYERMIDEIDSQIQTLNIKYKEKNSTEWNDFLNLSIENVDIIDGFKFNDSNFIISDNLKLLPK